MPRITISVSADLKERLDDHGDRFNISAVCQEALEAKIRSLVRLDDLVAKSRTKGLLQRLKADLPRLEESVANIGREHGAAWAAEHGDTDTLHRLHTELAGIEGGKPSGRIRNWFEQHIKHPTMRRFFHHDQYVMGFVHGAVDAYRAALKKLAGDQNVAADGEELAQLIGAMLDGTLPADVQAGPETRKDRNDGEETAQSS